MRVNKWVFWVILLVFSIFSTMFFAFTTSGGGDWAGLGMLVIFGFTYGITLITIFFINIITYFFNNDSKLTISKNFLMILLLVQGTALITNFTNAKNFSEVVEVDLSGLLKYLYIIYESPDLLLSFDGFYFIFTVSTFILLVLYILIYSIGVIVLGIKVIIETIKSIIKKDIRIKRSNIALILLLVVQFATLFINLIYCDSIKNNIIHCGNDPDLLSGWWLSILLYIMTFIVFIIHAYVSIVFRNIKSKWINPPLRK